MKACPSLPFHFAHYLLLGLLASSYLNASNFPIDNPLTPTKGVPANSIPSLKLLDAAGIQNINSWLVLGPYGPAHGPIDRYWEDFLGGKKDQELGPQDIIRTIESLPGSASKAISNMQGVIASGPASQIYFDDALSLVPISTADARRAAYATCEVSAQKSGEFALFVRSDGAVRLWVNNSEAFIQQNSGDEYAVKFRQCAIVHLNKGRNFILAHVVYDSAACGLWLAISADINGAIQMVADALNQRLTSAWCFHAGDTIPIELPVSGISSVKVRLVGQGTTTAFSPDREKITIPAIASKDSGIEYLSADIHGVQITQPIFVGDASVAVLRYRKEFSEIADHTGSTELNAALHRCEHLLEPSHFTPGDLGWQQKFATQAAIFEESVP